MLSGVFQIDMATYGEVLDFNIMSGGNLLILGMAGTGKTEMAQAACGKMGYEYQYLNLSVLEAPDLIGLPTITDDGRVVYATPQFLPRKTPTSKPVVLVVDEIDKSKPELQAPLLELFQSHSINGTALDIKAIVATGNLPDEGAFSQPISHALTNRCKVFQLTHSFDTWADWAGEAGVNPLVIGFLSKNREYLSRPAVEGDPTAYCRESPRSWTWAAADLDKTTSKNSVDFQTLLVAGRVGSPAAAKFRVWLDYYRHVQPIVDLLISNGTHPQTNDMTIDKQLVCAISAVNEVAQLGKSLDGKDKAKATTEAQARAKRVFSWIRTLPSEFQIGAVKSTLSMKLVGDYQLTKVPEVMEMYLKIRSAMKT